MIRFFLMSLFLTISFPVFSHDVQNYKPCVKQEINHSGGTDKCGCHFNRKTGEYHCHNRKQRGGDCPP